MIDYDLILAGDLVTIPSAYLQPDNINGKHRTIFKGVDIWYICEVYGNGQTSAVPVIWRGQACKLDSPAMIRASFFYSADYQIINKHRKNRGK